MTRLIAFAVWMVLLTAWPELAATETADPLSKGVVLVMIDDIGYGDIDLLHPSDLATPSLDKLCRESVRLTDYHVGTTCSPTRASLMTGRFVNAGGVWHTIAGRELLRADEQTMADVFRANGWKTGVFGKWHLGEGYPFSPRFRGFDVTVIHGGGGIGQGPDFWNNDYYSQVDFDGNFNRADVYYRNGHPITADKFCTDYWFDHATKFIKDCVDADQPFFCYVPTNAAHGPFNAPHGFKQGFDGLIENIDFNMGRLDEFLNQLNIKDDVLLIFTTDNGTAGERFGGLRGKKGSHYDGGHNVPCLWRWKNGRLGGSEESARQVAPLTAAMDLLPTFIEMFNLKRPAGGHDLHGISLKNMLLDPQHVPNDRTIVVDTQRRKDLTKWKQACVMQDDVVDGKIAHKWRLVRKSGDHEPELYDFLNDRDTNDDIASANAEKISELSKQYESWWSTITPGSKQYPPFVVNGDKEPELTLHAHCWIGESNSPWHQNSVRNGAGGSGVHAIKFDKPGRYRFELRRWPTEDGGEITAKSNSGEGKPLPVKRARLAIAGVGQATQDVPPGAASVVFEMEVGLTDATTIETEFLDDQDQKISGAYYVYVRQAD